ncbi:putative ferrooxidoreductase Fet3 [Mollisia scopiformis]|uniref:Putative ferrooxidoreductase Fet3 n=1 Tax=Mollisia scopiformis TaxID=149040 RepID=A0A194XWH2_MOLSC|nr:putative ferrooxidoreductase Fet3 [Mollisia scopiformis]KUJ24481.1 putative ferrooxidoreductase Fet3 [Mollisia scopiformis]
MLTIFIFISLFSNVLSSIVTYDWEATWVYASPDDFARPVIGINGKFPCPNIDVNLGDRIIINFSNKLVNETTSLHFHGLFQTGTSAMDGPVGVNQCPVYPEQTLVYDFVVDQVGTFWYHAHNGGSYMDGLRGAIIIHDPSPPFEFDEDVTITLSDWYQDEIPGLVNYFESQANEDDGGAEPIPNSAVMQDTQNVTFPVKPGKTYLMRFINIGGFVGTYVSIDDHTMSIVEIDGIYVEPKKADELYLSVAQRYAVLVTMKSSTDKNYAISVTLDTAMFDSIPPWANPDVFGWLVYDSKKPLPTPVPLRTYNTIDDTTLVPVDHMGALTKVDHQIIMTFNFEDDIGYNRAIINNITYIGPTVPTLFTVMSAPAKDVMNPIIYGQVNPSVLKHNDVIEIVLINQDTGSHPWHLHGHAFQVIERSAVGVDYDPDNVIVPKIPMRRDTLSVMTGGYAVLRFKADNPGVFLFHCHIEWHVEAGLVATIIEAPDVVAATQGIPHDHFKSCEEQGIPTTGNAAGNTKNYTDMTGLVTQFETDNWG